MKPRTEHDFFFISYNWNDDKTVAEDIEFFKEKHANYWLDKDGMRAADDSWIKRAETTIADEHCRGAVFYLSTHSLSSEAVEKEIDIVREKKKYSQDFFVLAVLIGGVSIPHLIKQTYNSVPDSQAAKVLPLRRISKLYELFSDEKVYRIRNEEDIDDYRMILLVDLTDGGVVHTKESLEEKLTDGNKLDAYKRFEFGMYYENEAATNVYLHSCNVFEEKNNSYYIKLPDNTVHAAKPIKWILLDYSDNAITLISEEVLEKIRGNDIDRWLNEDFPRIAFNEEEKSMLNGRIRTLTFEEYSKYSSESNINPTMGSFWLDSINTRNQPNMLMCVMGSIVDQIGRIKSNKLGIRPVIEIKIEKVLGGIA